MNQTTARKQRSPGRPLALIGLAAVLLMFFLWPYVQEGFRFPLGADAPVYLWWARLAGHDGLSAVGERPGIPALLLVLSQALHLPLTAVTAGLEAALGVGVGLGAAGLVRSRHGVAERAAWALAKQNPERDRPEWLLAGVLAGAFAVHLVAGYAANLAFAAGFLAAAVALASGTRGAAVGAAFVLGGAGLMHPQFFGLGLGILVATAVPSLLRERGAATWSQTEFGRIGIAVGGAGVLVGAGLLALLAGPGPPDVETSKDGLLRRVGLTGELRGAFVDRFVRRWARYVPWAQVPLAVFGMADARGFVGRFLRAWGVASILGMLVGFATAWFPPDRFVTFGYVVPILAALGLVRLARALAARRALAASLTAGICAAMLAGAAIAWSREEPFITAKEVEQVTAVGRIAAVLPPETELVFRVDSGSLEGLFLAARAGNVIRAALPAERIRRTLVLYSPIPSTGSRPAPGSEAAVFLELFERRLARFEGQPASRVFVAADAFSTTGARQAAEDPAATEAAPGVWMTAPLEVERGRSSDFDRLEPTSPGQIVLASMAVLALLWVAGYGWARLWLGATFSSLAIAPAFGMAALALMAVLADIGNVSLDGTVGATSVALLAGGGGYLVALVLHRRTVAQPASQVHHEPDE